MIGAKLDYENRTLVVHNDVILLKERSSLKNHCLVKAKRTTYLGLRSVSQIACAATRKSGQIDTCVITPVEHSPLFHDNPGVEMPEIVTNAAGMQQSC